MKISISWTLQKIYPIFARLDIPKRAIMNPKQQQFASEVAHLKETVNENQIIQKEVNTNLENVEGELGRVEILMKNMKSDILQYRYALDGMTEYGKELDIVGFYYEILMT